MGKRIILSLTLMLSIIMINVNMPSQETIENNQEMSNYNSVQQNTERMAMLEELQKENSDIIGWLEIPDSNISYPVLQGKDNNFYMNHNYKKQYSKPGSLFLDKDYDWSLPSTNLLIYGHNNKGANGMFGRAYEL